MASFRKVRRVAGTAAAATLAVAAVGLEPSGAARAQVADADGGFLAALTLSQQLFASDDGGLGTRTSFALALTDATRTQSLSLEGIGGYERAFGGERADDGFDRPSFRAGYGYETRGTAISLEGRYSSSDVDDTFADPLTGFLILDSGTRTNLGAGATIQFGRDAPFGGTLAASRDSVTYDGTTDPRLRDTVTDRAGGTLVFRIDPRIELSLGADYLDADADGTGTDRRFTGVSAGAALAVTQTVTVTGSVTYDRTVLSGGRVREEREGFGLTLGGVLDRPNGALRAQLSSRVTENGRRARLDLGRSLALSSGELTFGVGLQESASGGFDPLYSLSYVQALPRGQLTAAAQQTYVTDIDSEEAIASTLSLGYSVALTPLDRIAARVVVQDNTVQTGTGVDARRAEFGLTYSRALTQDWALVAGAAYDRDRRGTRDATSDSEVFLGIERRFRWRD